MAAIAGYFHIPVIMLSGDQAACDEIRELQPNAQTVAVKGTGGKRVESSAWRTRKPNREFGPRRSALWRRSPPILHGSSRHRSK